MTVNEKGERGGQDAEPPLYTCRIEQHFLRFFLRNTNLLKGTPKEFDRYFDFS